MKVRIKPLGPVAGIMGTEGLELDMKEGNTLHVVRKLLTRQYSALEALWPSLAIAINGEFLEGNAPLKSGDEILLVSPISGG